MTEYKDIMKVNCRVCGKGFLSIGYSKICITCDKERQEAYKIKRKNEVKNQKFRLE